MSNYQNPEKNGYSIYTDTLEFFIVTNGFKIQAISSDYREYLKNGIEIKIPKEEKLSKDQVIEFLNQTGLTLADFETFVKNNSPSNVVKGFIKAAINTPPLKS
jgi:hypothetical protein